MRGCTEVWRWLTRPRLVEAGGDGHLGGDRVRRRLAKRLGEVARGMDRIGRLGVHDVAAVHALRIAGKKTRYELELVEDAFPEAGEALDRLKPLQELLGEAHDADVRLGFLPRFVVGVARVEQPGAVRLLALELAARDRASTEMESQLAAWHADEVRRLAGRIAGES